MIRLEPLTSAGISRFNALHDRPCFGGCYCAVWTALGPDWAARCAARAPNRQETADRVQRGEHVGFLVYEANTVVAWTGAGPRSSYPRLSERKGARISPAGTDDWIVGCFAVLPEARGRGIAGEVLEAVVGHAMTEGARCIDAFPVRPWDEPRSYRGSEGLYLRHGFKEIASEPDDTSTILVLRRVLR